MLEKYGYYTIPSYTDRLPRYKGEKEHIFITAEEYQKLKGQLAGYTYFHNHNYFTTKEQIRDIKYTTYVIDPDGIRTLKEHVTDIEYVTIYIKTRRIDRIKRMRQRGDSDEQIEERLLNDIDKFKKIDFDYAISNNNLKKAVQIIKNIIEMETNE